MSLCIKSDKSWPTVTIVYTLFNTFLRDYFLFCFLFLTLNDIQVMTCQHNTCDLQHLPESHICDFHTCTSHVPVTYNTCQSHVPVNQWSYVVHWRQSWPDAAGPPCQLPCDARHNSTHDHQVQSPHRSHQHPPDQQDYPSDQTTENIHCHFNCKILHAVRLQSTTVSPLLNYMNWFTITTDTLCHCTSTLLILSTPYKLASCLI